MEIRGRRKDGRVKDAAIMEKKNKKKKPKVNGCFQKAGDRRQQSCCLNISSYARLSKTISHEDAGGRLLI